MESADHDSISVIERATNKPAQCKQLPSQPGDVPLTWADISNAGKILGYKPKTTLEEGIAKFVAWYHRQPVDLRA